MRSRRRTSPPVGLLVISLGFLVLATVLVLFSRELFGRFSAVSSTSGLIALAAVLTLTLILFGLIMFQTVRLVRDRALRRPGSLLKTRFILFITTLVLAGNVPLLLVSYNFIDLAANFWLSAGVDESIRGATRLAVDYRATTRANLAKFSESRLFDTYLAAVPRGAAAEWKAITQASPFVSFIQVFDDQGHERAFHVSAGIRNEDVHFRSLEELRRYPEESQVSRRTLSFLLSRLERRAGEVTYTVALGTVLSPGFLDTSRRLEEAAEDLRNLGLQSQRISVVVLVIYALFTLPILLLCLLASFYLAEELVLPIMSLEDAIRRVAQGDFSFRVLVRSRDELSVLANSFNRMVTELSDSRSKLLQAEKIAAWKEIARRLAHELRNPLTPIKLSAQRILRRVQSPHTPQELEAVVESSVQTIAREVELLDGLLREFSDFARLPEPNRAPIRIAEVVEHAVSAYSSSSPDVRFETSGVSREVTVSADEVQLRRVFANLLANARAAMPQGGTLTIQADVVRKGESSYCRVVVRDTGVGMDDDTRRQAFLPYFTTRKDGTGLGLAIVERIVFDHDGQIWIESHVGSGTAVYLDLPLA